MMKILRYFISYIIFTFILIYLLYYGLLSSINSINEGESIKIDGSLFGLLGLVIFVAYGCGLALNIIHSEKIPIIHKVFLEFVGGCY